MAETLLAPGARPLTATHESLALGVPRSRVSTIFALALTGGIAVPPRRGREIFFGRNRTDVHVCLGEDDPKVSRRHGMLVHHDDQWWVSNLGKLPIRLSGQRLLFPGEEDIPLTEGYTPLFLRGSRKREHLLELYVTGADGAKPIAKPEDLTQPPRVWRLQPDERLALIVLGQRYLSHEPYPQPLSRKQVFEQLDELQPTVGWTTKKVEHLVGEVRDRLSRAGVSGLLREEVGEPVGNSLNHKLIQELMFSTTLVPRDLALLDGPDA
jgi:hypothetical protein